MPHPNRPLEAALNQHLADYGVDAVLHALFACCCQGDVSDDPMERKIMRHAADLIEPLLIRPA